MNSIAMVARNPKYIEFLMYALDIIPRNFPRSTPFIHPRLSADEHQHHHDVIYIKTVNALRCINLQNFLKGNTYGSQ